MRKMKRLNQEKLDNIVSGLSKRKYIHGAVIHLESKDRSQSLFSATGNLTPESTYYIASINKLVLSLITFRFHQSGQLDINDKISKFLSNEDLNKLLIIKREDFTSLLSIRHLMSHTSGLPCYLIDKRHDGKKNMDLILSGNDQAWPIKKVIAEVKKMKPKFKPGTPGKAAYSETNFRLLGKILEVISQKSLHELLTDLFIELKMDQTFVLPTKSYQSCAPVYFKENNIELKNYWSSTLHDIASTAADQMKFLRAFFDGNYLDQKILSEELQQWNNIFFPFKYGVGLQKFYMPRIFSPFKAIPDFVGHCGSVGSVAFYIPDKELYITGTVNQAANPNIVFQTMVKLINKT